jgi:hypothetical protein
LLSSLCTLFFYTIGVKKNRILCTYNFCVFLSSIARQQMFFFCWENKYFGSG